LTIRRRIQGVFATILLLVLGSGAVYLWNARQVERGIEAMGIDFKILQAAFMLRILTEEYSESGSERPMFQWERQYESLGRILEQKRADSKDQSLVDKLRHSYKEVGLHFRVYADALAAKDTTSETARQFLAATRQMLSDDLEKLGVDAYRLHTLRSSSTAAAQGLGLIIIVLLTGATAIIVALHLFTVDRAVLRPLDKFVASTAVIGERNFDHTIEVGHDDEIGRLSRAFNDMTTNLRSVYDSLEAEINERKRKEAELIRSNQDLEQFAYIASHDLQEPLRNVSSAMQLLEKRYSGRLGEDADMFMRCAVDSVTAMKTLITDLLAFSRVATRGFPFEKVSAEAAFTQSLQNLRSLIREKNAEVTCDPLPEVMSDANQLSQVFQNLISNGIKFNKSSPPRVHVSSLKQDNEWLFAVQDNGIGIEDRHTDRIFLIFRRLHKKHEYGGTGIGLAIVKKIVERHGGNIRVESQIGTGTTVYFTLPVRQEGQE